MAFFSHGVQSLMHNFPKYKQKDAQLCGPTCQAVEDAGLRLDLQVPSKEYRSMSEAISSYIQSQG